MRDRLEKMVRFKKFVCNELSSQDRVCSLYTTTSYILEIRLHFHRTVIPLRAHTWPVLGPTTFYAHLWRSSVHCSCAVVSIRDMAFLAIHTQSLRVPCHEGTAESKSGDAVRPICLSARHMASYNSKTLIRHSSTGSPRKMSSQLSLDSDVAQHDLRELCLLSSLMFALLRIKTRPAQLLRRLKSYSSSWQGCHNFPESCHSPQVSARRLDHSITRH
jgi:hypothetical protein